MKSEKKGFIQCARTVFETVRLILRLDKRNLIAFVGNRLLRVFQPFVLLYFTSSLIDSFAEPSRPAICIAWILGLVFTQLTLQLLESYTDAMITVEGYQLYWLLFLAMDQTMMHADYAAVEAPELKRRMDRIIRQENLYWCGPWEVPGILMNLVEGVVTTTISLIMAWPVWRGTGGAKAWLGRSIMVSVLCISILYIIFSERKLYEDKEKDIDSLLELQTQKEFYRTYLTPECGAKDLRLFAQNQLIGECCRGVTDAWSRKMNERSRMEAQVFGARGILSQLLVCIAYGIVSLMAIEGTCSVGRVVRYVGALSQLSGGIRMLVYSLIHIRIQGLHCREYLDFLTEPNSEENVGLTIVREEGEPFRIEFKNVSFSYPGTDKAVLKNVSFCIEQGQKIAVVGKNGSGKSTLVKLLCRLYEPTKGEILLNGTNIRSYSLRDYRLLLSAVFQDFTLFALPVGENIASGTGGDENKIWGILRKTNMENCIRSMPKQLEQPLYGIDPYGIDVSGGEGQKIAIARALYRNSDLLIMDEPTAALDPVAEYEIYSQFRKLTGERAAVYISHRLSSCRFCDKILVFNQGSILQEGTHEELLLEAEGLYRQLWQAQAQYYQTTAAQAKQMD